MSQEARRAQTDDRPRIFLNAGFDLSSLSAGRIDPRFTDGLFTLVGIARGHLANALHYIQIIPSHETGIRRHVRLP